MATIKWAGYPAATVYGSSSGKDAVDQLLWGHYVSIAGDKKNGRYPISRSMDRWIDAGALQDERLLEIVFVDIGQGDGALVVTPDDQKMIVDAGEGDNMYRFLRWRFGDFNRKMKFSTVVISHGDQDHWGGFARLFSHPNLTFGTVYHNGLVERAGAASASLGERTPSNGRQLLTDIVGDTDQMRALLDDAATIGKKKYAALLKQLLESGRVGGFQAMGRVAGERRHLPGFGPSKALSIEVLGPIVEPIDGTPALRWLGSVAKTKNGHSVVLKLRYHDVSIMLGGDLNTPSEDLLLSTHTGFPSPAKGWEAEEAMVTAARRTFECDFAKACHHGSADFSGVFLRAVNPLATIVSSGDEESYAHPRPDALGAYGLCGRGPRPMIFSTELFRSSAERVKFPNKYRAELLEIVDRMLTAQAASDSADLAAARKKLEAHLGDINRSVAVYGAVNLRTDGHRAVIAYKIEKPRSPSHKWDLYQFEPGPDGRLRLAATSSD